MHLGRASGGWPSLGSTCNASSQVGGVSGGAEVDDGELNAWVCDGLRAGTGDWRG